MQDVALALNMHDPIGSLKNFIPTYFPLLSKTYSGMYVVATSATDATTIEELEKFGVSVELQEGGGVGLEYIGDARRQALRSSVRNGHSHTHFIDIDRLIRWLQTYPDELNSIVKQIPSYDFLIIGRTQRAFDTHTRCQMETERLANKVCSLILGQEVDITAASRGLSKGASETILKYSKARYVETDSEWPVIIHCCSNTPIGYREAEGLGFEAGVRHSDEVEIAGGFEAFKKIVDNSPESWLHRIRYAMGISATAISTYESLKRKSDIDEHV